MTPRFACDFCKVTLSTETYLLNHVCEQKRRWLRRDEKAEKIAFMVYHHFHTKTMARRTPTHQSFARSSLYLAFVRFARHLIALEVSHPLGFVDFLLRIELPIDRWTNPEVYARYIRERNKNELPLEAIDRNFMLMKQWSIATGEDWRDFFRGIAPPQATLWIVGGRISPWLLFTASSAMDLMQRLSPEQTQMVERAIDTEYWQAKLARHHDEIQTIRVILAEHRI